IYERSDGIVHSKSMVVDDVWSLVGSSNFDQRSVLFNDEIDAVILGKSTADRLRAGSQRRSDRAAEGLVLEALGATALGKCEARPPEEGCALVTRRLRS